MIVTQDLVYNSILSLHLGRGVVYKFSQNGKFGQNGKLSQNGKFGQYGKFSQNCMSSQKGLHLGPNVSSSAHDCGRVVDGGGAMAAI